MSDWEIRIPHRDPSSPITEIAESARALPQAERAVTRQLVLDLAADHDCRTVGDALRVIESADPASRRAVLDQARERVGLPSTDEIENRQRYEHASLAGRLKAGAETRPLRLALSPSGAIVDLNERDDEAARAREDERRRAVQRAAREDQRAVEAQAWREHKQAIADQVAHETPPGVPG